MNENTTVLKPEDPVSFTFPEGLSQVAAMLEFIPEPQRLPLLLGLINQIIC